MPSKHPIPDPAITADALESFLRRHGPAMARAELALWDLSPKFNRPGDGSITLTAFHDPQGVPAVHYRLDAQGQLTRRTASDRQQLPKWLRPRRQHRRASPARPRAPSRRDPARLPDTAPVQYDDETDPTILLTCTQLVRTLRRLLAVWLITRTAAVASDYLPNHALRGRRQPPRPT